MEEKERDIANDKKDEEEKQEEENYDKIKDEFQNKYSKYIKFTNKMLGSKVYELVLNKSISGAGKIVKYKKSGVNNKSNEIDFSNVLKGGNIIRQHAAYELKDEKK